MCCRDLQRQEHGQVPDLEPWTLCCWHFCHFRGYFPTTWNPHGDTNPFAGPEMKKISQFWVFVISEDSLGCKQLFWFLGASRIREKRKILFHTRHCKITISTCFKICSKALQGQIIPELSVKDQKLSFLFRNRCLNWKDKKGSPYNVKVNHPAAWLKVLGFLAEYFSLSCMNSFCLHKEWIWTPLWWDSF